VRTYAVENRQEGLLAAFRRVAALKADPYALLNDCGMADFQSRRLACFDAELLAETSNVVSEDGSFAAGAGDGDVAESGAEQVGMNACIGVDEDALRGQPLGAVAGYGIAMVEMPVLGGVEFEPAVVVEPGCDSYIERD
jgi:hypothetical protein